VTTSIFAVASSKITSFDFLRIALHIQINYLSPELKLPPFSEICISRPLGSFYIIDKSYAFSNSS